VGPDAWPLDYSGVKYGSFDEFANDIRSTKFISNTEAKQCLRSIPRISLFLFSHCSDYAFPYLFPQHFYILQAICKEFDIKLPPLPDKKDSIARFCYYVDICRALYEFRVRNNMTPSELCAFVYGFAMRDVKNIIANCQKHARNIYMVIASAVDQAKLLNKNLKDETVAVWQGRESMRIGDIVLMYEQSPSKSFGSVWRAVSPGFDDPFDLYPGKVFLGEPVQIPRIGFIELCNDKVWSNKPEVRAHMQGGSGRTCSVAEYEALKKMVANKSPNFVLSALPEPPETAKFDFSTLNVEHDVETNLLEPLLINLGFKNSDWVKQYSVRIGRDNASRPDYLIGLRESSRGPRASLVFEAKLTIPSEAQRRKDHGQAVAYGGILSSDIVSLVAKEGLWIYKRSDEFDFDKGLEYSWVDLEKPETIAELSQLFRPNGLI